MPNPENIEPHKFKKGQTGNPNGRPKLPDLKEAMAKILGEEKDGRNALEAILSALRSKAAKGDVRAAELLFKYTYRQASNEHTLDGEIVRPVMRLPDGSMMEI